MKRCLTGIIIFVLIIAILPDTSSAANYGTWASNSINNAICANILKPDNNRDYFAPITRLELASLITTIYKNVKGNINISYDEAFIDTTDINATTVAKLGIMNGYGDGTFLPNNFTSRQEMAKILLTYQSVMDNNIFSIPDNFHCSLTDFNNLSDWAKPYVATAVNNGLLNGYEDGTFGGLKSVSWQEAVVMLERVCAFPVNNNYEKIISDDFKLKTEADNDIISITWEKIDNLPHIITITEQRLSRYPDDIPPNTPTILTFTDENKYIFTSNPNKKYTIQISCNNYICENELYTEKKYFDDVSSIHSSYPTTEEEAEAIMTEVTVPIWTLQGTIKAASEITFKVHNDIAEKIRLIFEEIFNGEEKFPIKDIGGYSWRGGVSEHNGGTAIDINSNENYCIYSDGTTIGSYWKPFEDPFSITPYGDVVKAFEKYGFTWGGDSWSNPKDYMHFSYLGT